MSKPSKIDLALVDSSVLVADLLDEEEKHGEELEDYRHNLRERLFKPVITTPILMELFGVIRRNAFSEFAGGKIGDNLEQYKQNLLNYVRLAAQKRFERTLNEIRDHPDDFDLVENLAIKMDEESVDFMKRNIGIFGGKRGATFKSLNVVDIIHIVVAKQLGCKWFVTFDEAFEGAKADDFLEELKILVYKRPSRNTSSQA